MSTRLDIPRININAHYLKKCQQVSELRWQVRRWQFLAWTLGLISAILLGILIWG